VVERKGGFTPDKGMQVFELVQSAQKLTPLLQDWTFASSLFRHLFDKKLPGYKKVY
jgi:hypothetical protein